MKMKLYVMLFGLTCSIAYAGHADETPLPMSQDINVTAPDQSGAWSLGVTAVLMQPTNQGYEYAISGNYMDNGNGGAVNPSYSDEDNRYLVLNENYYWWFGADVTYAFPGHGRDVTLAYEGLHGSTTDTASNDFNNDINSSEQHALLNTITQNIVDYIEPKTDSRYDAGDLLFGQKMEVGSRVQLHPFIGLRYAHIDVQYSFQDTLEPFPNSDDGLAGGNEHGSLESTFNGIGPRLGSDAAMTLGRGFSIRGRLGLSVLIGSEQYDAGYVSYYDWLPSSQHLSNTDTVDLNSSSKTKVVPEIDGRLGLNYSHNLDTTMALGVEIGWQASNYFQVIDDPVRVFIGGTPGQEKFTDFGLQGPYARVQLDIA